MRDIISPNDIEHILLSYRAMERMQNLVDEEVEKQGEEQLWPEHWEEAGGIHVWKCDVCERLFLNARDDPQEIVVYRQEVKGLTLDYIKSQRNLP